MATGKMDLIFVPETGKNAADIVFTYAKNREGKQGVRLEITGKKAKFEAGTAIGFTFLRCK